MPQLVNQVFSPNCSLGVRLGNAQVSKARWPRVQLNISTLQKREWIQTTKQ